MATIQQRLRGAEMQARVLDLARAGHSFREIAAEVGYKSPASAHYALKQALKAALRPAAEEYLELELQRLDAMHQPLWTQAQRGNLKAQQQVLALMERRAAYLGLDAPKKLAGHDGGPLQLEVVDARERLLQEVQQRRARVTALPTPAEQQEQSA